MTAITMHRPEHVQSLHVNRERVGSAESNNDYMEDCKVDRVCQSRSAGRVDPSPTRSRILLTAVAAGVQACARLTWSTDGHGTPRVRLVRVVLRPEPRHPGRPFHGGPKYAGPGLGGHATVARISLCRGAGGRSGTGGGSGPPPGAPPLHCQPWASQPRALHFVCKGSDSAKRLGFR